MAKEIIVGLPRDLNIPQMNNPSSQIEISSMQFRCRKCGCIHKFDKLGKQGFRNSGKDLLEIICCNIKYVKVGD